MTTVVGLRRMTGTGIGEQKVFNRTKRNKMSENNVVDVVGDAAVTGTAALGQDAATPLEDKQESKTLGADVASSTPIEEAAKPEEGEVQVTPEADASEHEESAGDKPAEPSWDLNNDADPSLTSEPAPGADADARLDEVLRKLDTLVKGVDEKSAGISEALRELMEAFKIKLQYDAAKQQVIDRQAASLSKYEKGLIDELIYKIANPILIQYTNMMDIASHYATIEKTPENFDKLLDEFTGFGSDLLQTVEDAGMTPFYADVGSRFDPHRQKVLKRVTTDNKDKDRTISRVICPGLERNDRVFRPLQAEVLIYSEPANQPYNSSFHMQSSDCA